jgi:hypothetical protein
MRTTGKCVGCMGTGWVCAIHRTNPWKGIYSCDCGDVGVPCGTCSEPTDRETVALPGVLEVNFRVDVWRPLD